MEASITSPVVKRPIRRPFFLLHTPDRLGNYLSKENLRVVMSRRERLSTFLAPATLVDSGTDTRGRTLQEISYDLSQYLQDAVQMEYLPEAVVSSFEQAVSEFCSQSNKVTDYEIKLRQGFRLPDPDLDPQAYIVYGPPENRQLIILWGSENKQDSSLPLIKPYGYDGPTIIEKLRSRVMGEASKRMEALKILDRANHPLSRFMAIDVRDANGVVQELNSMGRRFPITTARRMNHLAKEEIEAFKRAASQYYAEASPESAAITSYEKELRAALRLPDPRISPQSYYVSNGKLLIVNSLSDNYDKCLHLKTDTTLGIPAPKTDASGRKILQSTIADELARHATPVKLYVTIAAASTVAVIGLAALGYALTDTTPPEVAVISAGDRNKDAIFTTEKVKGQDIDTPTKIRIDWTEPLDAEDFTTDKCKEFFSLSEKNHDFKLDKPILSEDGKTVTLKIIPSEKAVAGTEQIPDKLEDGKTYKLKINGIRDTSLRHNVLSETPKTFTYFDTMPPEVVFPRKEMPSPRAEGTDLHKVIIDFNEKLDKKSVDPRCFEIEVPESDSVNNHSAPRFYVEKAEYFEKPLPARDPGFESEPENEYQVVLTCKKSSDSSNDLGCFIDGETYVLTYERIGDVSQNNNGKGNSIDKKKSIEFLYKDTVPPAIQSAKATAQMTLQVVLSEEITKESVVNTGTKGFSIDILNRDETKLPPDFKIEVKKVEINEANTVSLTTSPMRRVSNNKAIKYQVSAFGITDVSSAHNTIETNNPSKYTFNYEGPEDATPPKIKSAPTASFNDNSRVEITFDEPIAANGDLKNSFTIYTTISDAPLKISSANVSGTDPNKVVITIADVPKIDTDVRAYIICKNISDEAGNVASTLKSDIFGLCKLTTMPQALHGVGSTIIDDSTIELIFTQKLNKAIAEQPCHYYFSGNAFVTSAKVTPDPSGADRDHVTIKLSEPVAKSGQFKIKACGLSLNGETIAQFYVVF